MYITALDLGSSKIKVLVAEIGKGELKLIDAMAFPSVGIRKGEVCDVQDVVKNLSKIFEEIRKINKSAVKNIFVNLGGKNVKFQNSRGIIAVSHADNEIYQDDVDRVIKASQAINISANRKILHTIIQEFVVDGVDQIKNPIGMSGTRLEVSSLIIDAFNPVLNDLNKSIDIAGGEITEVVYSPIADSASVLNKTYKELGSVLIDIGFGTTSMAVFEEDNLIAAKVFPLGSSNITNDLAIALKASIDTAEKIKTTHGHAFSREVSAKEKIDLSELDENLKAIVSKKYISEIIEVRLAEIFELIHNELKSIGKTQLPAGVILCGGGSKLDGVMELAKHELKLPVHMGNYDLSLFNNESEDIISKVDDMEFSLVLGLLNYGCGQYMEKNPRWEKNGFISKIFRSLMP